MFAHVMIQISEQGGEKIGCRAGHMVRGGLRHLWVMTDKHTDSFYSKRES